MIISRTNKNTHIHIHIYIYVEIEKYNLNKNTCIYICQRKCKLCILYNPTRTRGNNLYTQMRMAQNDRPGGYTTSTSINPSTIPTHLHHLVGHLRHLQHLPQAQAGLPPTSRSLSIFDVPLASKFVSSQHVSYFVAICCNTIIPRQTACLKPQLLLRSTLSLSRASSPAVCCQWTDVDTPKRYPAIHFKHLQTWLSNVMSCWATFACTKKCQKLSIASDSKLLAPKKCFRFQIFR